MSSAFQRAILEGQSVPEGPSLRRVYIDSLAGARMRDESAEERRRGAILALHVLVLELRDDEVLPVAHRLRRGRLQRPLT